MSEIDPAMLEVVATALLQSTYQFLRLAELHDSKNKIFDEALKGIIRTTENLMKIPGHQVVELTFRGEHIFINRVRLRPRPRQFYVYRFILKFMRFRRIGSIILNSMPSPDQYRKFLWNLSRTLVTEAVPQPALHVTTLMQAEAAEVFVVKPITKLQSGEIDGDGSKEGETDVEFVTAFLYEELRKFADVLFENLEKSAQFNLRPLSDLLLDLSQISEEDLVHMLRLVSVKRYDRPLPYRAVNSCFLIYAWAFSLRLPMGVMTELASLALIHPLSLDAQGQPQNFTPESRNQILEKVERLKNLWPLNELQTLSLLEWGTPYGKGGVYEVGGMKCYQHFFSRMLRIVADFERFTTFQQGQRVYLPDEALAEFFRLKETYDPTLLKLFVNWMGVYPVGSLVQLQTGEVAQVFAASSDPTKFSRPIVSILKDSAGKLLPRPSIFDLSEMNEKLGTYRKTIRKSLSLDEAAIPADRLKIAPATF